MSERRLFIFANCCKPFSVILKYLRRALLLPDAVSIREVMQYANDEKLLKLHNLEISPVWLLPQVMWAVVDFFAGTIKLWRNQKYYTFRIVLNGLLVAMDPNSSWARSQLLSIIENSKAASVLLDIEAKICSWGRNAEELFLFKRNKVIHKPAFESFIPEEDSSGLALKGFINEKLFRDPEMFRIHCNENSIANGKRIFVFWLNIPIYEQERLISMQCYGIKVFSPNICYGIISLWQSKVKLMRMLQRRGTEFEK